MFNSVFISVALFVFLSLSFFDNSSFFDIFIKAVSPVFVFYILYFISFFVNSLYLAVGSQLIG